MDAVGPVAGQVVAVLAPFLPRLLAAGGAIVEGAEHEVHERGWELAKSLWQRLRPGVEAKPAAREAAADVASHPDDVDVQASLRVQLRKLLSEDRALAEELARLLEAGRQAGSVTTVSASDRGVAAGGDISGGTIITGDRNRVGR